MGVRDHVLLQSPSTDGVEGRRDDNNKTKHDRRAALLSKNNRRKLPNSPNLAAASNRKRLSSSEAEQRKRSDRRERARRRSARERRRSRSRGEHHKRRSRSSSSKSERTRHNRKPIKRVHFETDSNDRIITHYAPPSSTRLGIRERNRLWWSPQECELKINRINEIADAYQGKRFYVERFVELFALCAQVDDDDEDGIKIDAKTMSNIRKFVQTPARGLEALVLSVLQRYRTRHVEVILNAQEELMLSLSSSSSSEDTPLRSESSSSSFGATRNLSPALLEERDRTLYELSQRNSRAGRLFAQVLARTDAAAVSAAGTPSSPSR